MIRTDNNVCISKFIYNKTFKIKTKDIFQYERNFDIEMNNKLYNVDYLNFGTDGIIRDILFLNKNKKIFFEEPTYMMVPKYSREFNLTRTSFEEADVVYVSYPNGAKLTLPNFEIKKYNKTIILDLSYYIYLCDNFEEFLDFANKCKQLGYFVLFGASKILGLAGLRVGMCLYNNKEIFNEIHQPWQITSVSKIILDKLWNSKTINKHLKVIKNSKKFFQDKFKKYIKFETQGPFLALSKDFKLPYKEFARDYGDYYRFSIVDKKLLKI